MNENLRKLIEMVAEEAATKAVNKLRSGGHVRYYFQDSFKKTEELLTLIPKLPDDHPQKIRVMNAMKVIEDDEYYGVIASKYFDGMTLDELADIYDCQSKTIGKNRIRLVKILTKELFPEDVVKELLQK